MDSLEDKQDWINRFKKTEGQVGGLQNMVETSRSCFDLLIQISSAKAALHQLGVRIFETYLREEFQLIISVDNPPNQMTKLKKYPLYCHVVLSSAFILSTSIYHSARQFGEGYHSNPNCLVFTLTTLRKGIGASYY